MTDLERALLELEIEWPATPDLAAAVSGRLAAEMGASRAGGAMAAPEEAGGASALGGAAGAGGAAAPGGAPVTAGAGGATARTGLRGRGRGRRGDRRGGRLSGWRRRVAAGALAVVLAAGGTLALSPAARSTVERWFGLNSVEIRRGPVPTPKPPAAGQSLQLGTLTDLATARRQAHLPVRAVDAPDAIYLGRLPQGGPVVSFVYKPRAGLPRSDVTGVAMLVQVFRASFGPYIQKTIGTATHVERVKDGYWLEGAHGFAYEVDGAIDYENQRVADTTLLIERDGVLIRVEGTMSKRQAIDIAARVR